MQVIHVLAKRNMYWFIYKFISEEEHSFSPSNIPGGNEQFFKCSTLNIWNCPLSLCLHVLHVQYVQWLLFSWIQSVMSRKKHSNFPHNLLSLERNMSSIYLFFISGLEHTHLSFCKNKSSITIPFYSVLGQYSYNKRKPFILCI